MPEHGPKCEPCGGRGYHLRFGTFDQRGKWIRFSNPVFTCLVCNGKGYQERGAFVKKMMNT